MSSHSARKPTARSGIEPHMIAVAVQPVEKAVSLISAPTPRLKAPTDVLVRVLEVGICGTDREICAFEYGQPPQADEHLILGHEALARVVAVGPAVTRVSPGDLVVPMVRRPCLHETCMACTQGRQDFCFTGEFTERGIKGRHGFMTELVVDDEQYFARVPESLRPLGVLVEPLTIAEKALEQIWQVQQRLPWACPIVPGGAAGSCHTAVVLGAGPVGLLGAMAFRAQGFATWVYSREPAPNPKSRIVEAIGAHYVSAAECAVGELEQRVGNIDVVFEATGASALSFAMLAALGTNAIFVFTGVPGRKQPNEIDTDLLMRNLVLRNQVVFGTVNAGRSAFEAAVRDLVHFSERWPQATRDLITGRFGIDAHAELLLGRPQGIKNVLCITTDESGVAR